MQFKSIILLALNAATISSWNIPQGQSDGVYSVEARDDGTFSHTLLAPATSEISVRRAPISRIERDLTFPETNTCLGYTLGADDNNKAFNALSASCNRAPSTTSLGQYSISGDVVVYWCNYPKAACSDCSAAGQACSPKDLSISVQTYLTNACGSFKAGWASWVRQSYGQESVSRDSHFCGNGLH